jgi:hypothetical protein
VLSSLGTGDDIPIIPRRHLLSASVSRQEMHHPCERWAKITGTEGAASEAGGPRERLRVPDDGISLNALTMPSPFLHQGPQRRACLGSEFPCLV